jgi:glycerophosphoryl diester phosphodiesterase
MTWLIDKPIAHRGLHDNVSFPENSLAAFDLAIKSSYPIELDLQLLRDERIAVFHDVSLLRMTGVDASIRSKSSSELKDFRLLETNQRIPLFGELLELINGEVPLLIEIKSNYLAGRFERTVIKTLNGYRGEYAIESFNPLTVLWMKENAGQVLRGMLSRSLFRAKLYAKINHPHFLAVNISKLNYYDPKVTAGRIPVIGYTAKSQDEFNLAMKICDNIIFEGFQP